MLLLVSIMKKLIIVCLIAVLSPVNSNTVRNEYLNKYSRFIVAIENEDSNGMYFRGKDLIQMARTGNIMALKNMDMIASYCEELKQEVLTTLGLIKEEQESLAPLCESIIKEIKKS